MTCQTLREAIVEVARGADAGRGTQAAVECHVERCAACAALMARERQLSLGLKALAASSSTDSPSEAMERRLLDMFAERQASKPFDGGDAGRQPLAVTRDHRLRYAMAAAAALVAIAGAATWWRSAGPRPVAQPAQEQVARLAAEPVSSPVPTAASKVEEPSPIHRSGKRSASHRPPAPRLAVASGFVELPGAVGLPDFESGQIIRMEIPLTSLPTYGIDIAPDARDVPVQADLLVGQDGQARGIRLVSDGGGSRK